MSRPTLWYSINKCSLHNMLRLKIHHQVDAKLYSKHSLIRSNLGREVIRISEAKGSSKNKTKTTWTQKYGKFNGISSADENKRITIEPVFKNYKKTMPITLVVLSKAWTVFARSDAGIVGSNPTQGMDICVHLFCVYVVLCVDIGLSTGWSPIQGVLPTAYRIKKLKKRPRSNQGL
jgi:hypothetical protein